MASGMATALVLVPAGFAQAAPESPADALNSAVEDAVAEVPVVGDVASELPDAGDLPGADDLPVDSGIEDPEVVDPEAGGETPDPVPPLELPDELAALFEELGIPAECVSSFQEIFEGLAAELAESPEEVPDQLAGLLAGLQEAFENQDPTAIDAALEELLGTDVLAQLEEALVACLPVEEEPEPEPEPEPTTPPVVHPAPEQPAPPAAHPVAQPVAYLGYAPTGADTARADDASVPLTALGGGLVLVAAGAAGYGMRGRAVRTRD